MIENILSGGALDFQCVIVSIQVRLVGRSGQSPHATPSHKNCSRLILRVTNSKVACPPPFLFFQYLLQICCFCTSACWEVSCWNTDRKKEKPKGKQNPRKERFLGTDPDEGSSGDWTVIVALAQQVKLFLNLG